MKKLPGLTAVVVLLTAVLHAAALPNTAKPARKPAPLWIKNVSATSRKINERTVTNGYFYQLIDEQVNAETSEMFDHYTMKIINDAGIQNCSEISIEFEPAYQQLSIHWIRVIRNGQLIDKLSMKDIRMLEREPDLESSMYDGRLTAFCSLSDIRKGDVIDYAYTVKGRNPVFSNRFIFETPTRFNVPVADISFRITSSPARSLQVKQLVTDYPLSRSKEKGLDVYEWKYSGEDPVVPDESTPSWFDPFGKIQVSEFKSWADVVEWALPLYPSDCRPGPELSAKVDELRKLGSVEDQVMAVLHFVQDEIRYMGFEIGESSHRPNNPNKVIRQRFGDCKDKALLMCTMLSQLGIEAYPNLVSTDDTRSIDTHIPSPYSFNHVTVNVRLNHKDYWFDATNSLQRGPIGQIQYPAYHRTLVIRKGEKALATIVANTNRRIAVHETFVVNHPDSPVLLRIKTTYEGMNADQMRQYFANESHKTIENNYLSFYKNLYEDIELAHEVVPGDDEEQNIFSVYEEYSIRNMWKDDADAGRKKLLVYPQILMGSVIMPENEKRTMPYETTLPSVTEQTIELKFLSAFPVTEETENITNDHFRYSYHFFNEGANSIITLKYKYESIAEYVTAADFGEYFKALKKVKAFDAYQVWWSDGAMTATTDTDSSSRASQTHILMVIVALMSALIFGYMAFRLYRYDREPRSEAEFAKPITGWLVLLGIILVLTIVAQIIQLFAFGYFDKKVWDHITNPETTGYIDSFGLLLVAELLFKVMFIVYAALLIALFIKRRSSFPFLFIWFQVAIVIFAILELIMAFTALRSVGPVVPAAIRAFLHAVLSSAIWIPYVTRSWRVRETFVFTYDKSLEKKYEVADARAGAQGS